MSPDHPNSKIITGKTRVFGVIADPIDHVRAPELFNDLMAAKGIDGVLVPVHIKPGNLETVMRGLAGLGNFGGVCVTIPHKLAAAELCDERSTVAEITGAVNVVRFENGRMIGDNFDGAGFIAGLEGEGIAVKGKNLDVLMIGAGGAARAIAAAVAESCTGRLTIANRTGERANAVAAAIKKHFGTADIRTIDLDTAADALPRADIVINATPLGLKPEDSLPLALKGASQNAVIADIIMEPAVTAWLREAESLGLRAHAGRHMLDYQRDLIARFLGIA